MKFKQNPTLTLNEFEDTFRVPFFEFDTGGNANTYKFTISKSFFVFETNLKPGNYVLKLFRKPNRFDMYNDLDHPFHTSSKDCIKKLIALSDLKLIPKIYIIQDNFIIMEYIDGIILSKSGIRFEPLEFRKIVFEKLEKTLFDWHRNHLYCGDLDGDNIILGKDQNVYIIDPSCNNHIDNKKLDLDSLQEIKKRDFWL